MFEFSAANITKLQIVNFGKISSNWHFFLFFTKLKKYLKKFSVNHLPPESQEANDLIENFDFK